MNLSTDFRAYRVAVRYLGMIEDRLGDCPTTTDMLKNFNLAMEGKLSGSALINQMTKLIDQIDSGTTIANGYNATK